ncbi:MAG: 2'-5' RNA ligase family protein [Lysobacteraceae bacterium]
MGGSRFVAGKRSVGAQQMGFDAIAPPVPTDRLFFALFPAPEAVDAIVDLQRSVIDEEGLSGQPVRADRLHVTLQHLGDFAGLPPTLAERAGRAAASLQEAAFDIGFDELRSFDSRRRQCPCVLTHSAANGAVHGFQRRLCDALLRAGVDVPGGGQFTPHVTLLYERRQLERRAIAPLVWTAQEFVLVHSLLGQTRHLILGRWQLQG